MRAGAKLSPSDRRALFVNTASKTGLTAAIIEKDFWVCWTLDYLFHRNVSRANRIMLALSLLFPPLCRARL